MIAVTCACGEKIVTDSIAKAAEWSQQHSLHDEDEDE